MKKTLNTRVTLLALLVATHSVLMVAHASDDDELLSFVAASEGRHLTPASQAATAPAAFVKPAPVVAPVPAAKPVFVSTPAPVMPSSPGPEPSRAATPVAAPVAPTKALFSGGSAPAKAEQIELIWQDPAPVSQAVGFKVPPRPAPSVKLENPPAAQVAPSATLMAPVPLPLTDRQQAKALKKEEDISFAPLTAAPEEPQALSARDEGTLERTDYLPSAAQINQTMNAPGPSENELRTIFYRASQIAIHTSPDLRSSQFDAEAARANVDEAKGARWPQVDVGTSSRSYQFGGGERTPQSNMPAFNVNMATTLYDFGQTSNTIDSREKTVLAADSAIGAQAEDIAWQVSSALVELSKQRLIVELSQQYVARMKELVAMLSGIVEADPGRRSELTQARGRELQAQSALDNALSKVRDNEITLYKLIGKAQIPLPRTAQWNLHLASLDRLLSAIDQHPTIRQAQAETEAALAEAKAVKSSNLPKVNWVMSKNTAEDINGRQQAWQTGINLSWGLFRGGSSRAAEQAAIQRAESSREKIEQQRRDLDFRVRSADQDARSMLQRADLYRNLTVESDRIRLAFFDQWYHLGKRTLLDVLSAESDYYNNRVGEVTNRFDGYSAVLRGYASAGQLNQWLSGNLR